MVFDATQYNGLIAKINAVKTKADGAESAQDVLREVEAFVPKRLQHLISTVDEIKALGQERPLYTIWYDAQALVKAQPVDPHAIEREEAKEAKRVAAENAAKNTARITAMEGSIVNAVSGLFTEETADLREYFKGFTLKLSDAGVYELHRPGTRGPKSTSSNGTGHIRVSGNGNLVFETTQTKSRKGVEYTVEAGKYPSAAVLCAKVGLPSGHGINSKKIIEDMGYVFTYEKTEPVPATA